MIRAAREELIRCRNLVLQLQKDCRTLECRRRELIVELEEKKQHIKKLERQLDETDSQ